MSTTHPPPRYPLSVYVWPVLFVLLLVGLLLFWRYGNRWFGSEPVAEPRAVTPRGDLAADEKSTIELFKEARQSVVHITTRSVQRDWYSPHGTEVREGTGTGFIWDKSGDIVTNFHVIQDVVGRRGATIQVLLWNHDAYAGRVVGYYPDKDIAVIRIDAPESELRPIPVGTSHDLQVGQKAFAIGNPFGLDQTLTTGVVSALGREITSVTKMPIKDVIQTDAAINPGNSGGPLLDSAGRLIGMNTAIYSPSGAYAGIGFAIPVDTINRVVPQLIALANKQPGQKELRRAWMGLRLASDEASRQFGVEGVMIVGVEPGSPAEGKVNPWRRNAAGRVVRGDVIVGIDKQPVKQLSDLQEALDKHAPGDTITLTVRRNGQDVQVPIKLGAAEVGQQEEE